MKWIYLAILALIVSCRLRAQAPNEKSVVYGTWMATTPSVNQDHADEFNVHSYIPAIAESVPEDGKNVIVINEDHLLARSFSFIKSDTFYTDTFALTWQTLSNNQFLLMLYNTNFFIPIGLRMRISHNQLTLYRTSWNAMPLVFEFGNEQLKDADFSKNLVPELREIWKMREKKTAIFEIRHSRAEKKKLGSKSMKKIWEKRIQNAKNLLLTNNIELEEIKIKKGPRIIENAGQIWIW